MKTCVYVFHDPHDPNVDHGHYVGSNTQDTIQCITKDRTIILKDVITFLLC